MGSGVNVPDRWAMRWRAPTPQFTAIARISPAQEGGFGEAEAPENAVMRPPHFATGAETCDDIAQIAVVHFGGYRFERVG